MCMPTGAFAQDAQSNDDDIHTSAQLRAEAAEQNADQERRLLEESTQNESDIVPLAEDSSYPAPWNEGTDTGVKDQPAQVAGVSSMQDDTVRGVNLTSYQAMKAARTAKNGYAFKDFDGNNLDDNGMMQLLKASGINYVLLKVAVNPTDGNGNTYGGGNPTLDNAIATAKAAQANGLNVNIQFLYSDFYTSKTVQKLPKGWPTNLAKLTSQVSDYTADSLSKLKAAGVTPNMVTIGSEISSPYYADSENKKDLQGGFLGQDDWKGMSQLISAASKAIRANNAGTRIAVGCSSVDQTLTTTYVDMLKYYKVDYDVIGTKVYAAYDDLNSLAQSRRMISEEYGKSMAVLDVLYPFTEYDSDGQGNTSGASDLKQSGKTLSPQGQADYIRSLYKAMVSAKNNAGGAGVFYGDATWIAVKGGLWNADDNWNSANEYGTGWASKYAADYVDYADNGGASQQDDAALFDDLGQPLQSLKVFGQLTAANPEDADMVPTADGPYKTGADTGAAQQTASVEQVPTVTEDTIRGADVSSYEALYKAGVRFKNFDGQEESLFKILHDNGVNWVRLRLFNDPYDENGNSYGSGTDDLDTVTRMAKEATQYGMKVLLDLHYNDFYASSWRTPKAWKGHNLNQLKTDVYDFTKNVMQTMVNNGVDLGMVQLGNESNSGLCGVTVSYWDNAKDQEWKNFVDLMNEGSKAIRQYAPKGTKVAVHFMYTDSGSADFALNYFKKYKLDYDVYGSTYYPFWSSGSDGTDADQDPMGALIKLEQVVTEKYKKEFAVVEFSYPFTENDSDGGSNNLSGPNTDKNNKYPYQVSVQGQADVIHDTLETVTSADGGTGLGLGAFYWEPAWIAVVPGTNHWAVNKAYANDAATGWASSYAKDNDPSSTEYDAWSASGWDNQAVFDDHGNPLQSLKAFKEVISTKTTPETKNGWVMDGRVRHWYDNGRMARSHAFYDPDSNAWYWADADGTIACDKDVFIPKDESNRAKGGKWVRFDANSHMVKGEQYSTKANHVGWYYFDPVTGEMAKGMKYVSSNGGKWVYYDWITGIMAHGEQFVNYDKAHTGWYLFDKITGAMYHGDTYIRSNGGKWVRYDPVTGIMVHGLDRRNGAWYYFDQYTGKMAHGRSWVPEWHAWHHFDKVTGRG